MTGKRASEPKLLLEEIYAAAEELTELVTYKKNCTSYPMLGKKIREQLKEFEKLADELECL